MTGLDRRINVATFISALVSVATLVFAAVAIPLILAGNEDSEEVRELGVQNACRAEVTAEAAGARGEVLRIIADGVAHRETGIDLVELAEANRRLEASQDRLAHVNDLCST